jgi:hypothetical protein
MIAVLQQLDEDTIRELLEDPDHGLDVIERCARDDSVDLDKAWHGLHFLLTGTAWEGSPPHCFLLMGGEEVEDVDLGYGPARLLRPPAVRAFATALSALDEETLRSRFDPARMLEIDIYPAIWDRPVEQDDTLGYLLAHFAALRDFVGQASAAGRGLLVYLS